MPILETHTQRTRAEVALFIEATWLFETLGILHSVGGA